MKKIIILQLVFIILLIFSGCSKEPVESNAADDTEQEKLEFNYSDTLLMMSEINEILTAASKGAGNPLAEIGGFSDELETIKIKSDDVITYVEQMIDSLDEEEDGTILTDNSKSIFEYRNNFESKLSEVKVAKKNTDISAVKTHLAEMIVLIDEYQAFLNEFEEALAK